MKKSSFPIIKARLLTGRDVEVPRDLAGKITMILLAFVRQEHGIVDTWIDAFLRNTGGDPDAHYIRIAMLESSIISNMVDLGMKLGVDRSKHEQFATAYGQRKTVQEALDIQSTEKLHVFLLDKSGNIVWKAMGLLDEKTQEAFFKVLNDIKLEQ